VRIVVDTSVLVAALRSGRGASSLWVEAILSGQHTLIISVPLVLEYEDVLCRLEMLRATGLDVTLVGEFLDGFCHDAERVQLTYRGKPRIRDPGDEMVLETAIVGRAEALLTFNVRDFLGAENFGVTVMTPGEAWTNRKAR
jgi:putative PIN family toxin of toxin-antitoxin system